MKPFLRLCIILLITLVSCGNPPSNGGGINFFSEHNLTQFYKPLGRSINGLKPILFLSCEDADLITNADLEIDADGTILNVGDFQIKTLADFPTLFISSSIVIDYSGSMSDQDIDDSIEVMTTLVNALKTNQEAEVCIFSDTELLKQSFTTDYNAVATDMVRDNNYTRAGTALYNAMGRSVESLTPRLVPIKLIFVFSDGQDTMSWLFTKNELITFAKAANVHVIFMGTPGSDFAVMQLKQMGPMSIPVILSS